MEKKIKNKNVLEVVHNLKEQRYADAAVIFAAGSVFRGEGTPTSDIDLVVLYDDPFEDVGRETIEAEGWVVESFIHNTQSLHYFFDEDYKRGMPVLMNMVHEGLEVPGPCDLSHRQKVAARHLLDLGPPVLDTETLQASRYRIGDALDDLRGVTKQDERYAILCRLYVDVADFYLRANGHWSGVGKGLVRALHRYAPQISIAYLSAFDAAFQNKDFEQLYGLIDKILEPHGGHLLHYHQNSGSAWRSFKIKTLENVSF